MAMENPLCGSFNRERTILTFRQRSLEVTASYFAMAGGAFLFLFGFASGVGWFGLQPVSAMWGIVFGAAFALTGLWAFLTFRQIRFDLRKKTFTERLGGGAMLQNRKGWTQEVRCLELGRYEGLYPTSKPRTGQASWGSAMPAQPVSAPWGTLLTLRLWWHDPNRPSIVVEHLTVGTAYGYQDQRTMHFVGLAQAYAQALGVPLTGSL